SDHGRLARAFRVARSFDRGEPDVPARAVQRMSHGERRDRLPGRGIRPLPDRIPGGDAPVDWDAGNAVRSIPRPPHRRPLRVVRANWSEPGPKPNARGLNIWFESSRVMYNRDQTAYAATRFAAAWQDVVRLLSSRTRETSRGILFSMQSSNPDVFLRVQDVDG